MSRMFKVNNVPMKTWNVWVGCDYQPSVEPQLALAEEGNN